MNWVFNRKIYTPFSFLGGVVVNIVNMAIMMIVLDLFFRVAQAKNSDWYHSAINQYTASDNFIEERMNTIFFTIVLVIGLIAAACAIILWLFRVRQCQLVESQIGIFRACGYPIKTMFSYLFIDGMIDIVLAAFFSLGFFQIVFSQMIHIEAFSSIYRITGYGKLESIVAWLVTLILFSLVSICQMKVWLYQQERKGIVVAIKQK